MVGRTRSTALVGYNHNIRHNDQLFHVQTEDSGVPRCHVITHLFAQGGWIIGTAKTSYAELLESPSAEQDLRLLMRRQHKAMAIALRDGEFDTLIAAGPPSGVEKLAPPDDPPETHTMGTRRLVSTLPPPPTAQHHWGEVTVMLERLAPEVGASLVDLQAKTALSLREGTCPARCSELVQSMVEGLQLGFGPGTTLVFASGTVAFSIIPLEEMVLFLEAPLASKVAVHRFRAVAHQVSDLVRRQ